MTTTTCVTTHHGEYMIVKAKGTSFGTENQFKKWTGPAMPLDQCSEANAIAYHKVDGSLFFAGANGYALPDGEDAAMIKAERIMADKITPPPTDKISTDKLVSRSTGCTKIIPTADLIDVQPTLEINTPTFT